MTNPFENPSKAADQVKSNLDHAKSNANDVKRNVQRNVKGNKWAMPAMVVVGVGAVAWYMTSDKNKKDIKHEVKHVSPDRDPRAPPSKMN